MKKKKKAGDPDIKKPGRPWLKELAWIGIFALAIGAVLAAAVYYRAGKKSDQQMPVAQLIEQKGISEEFFKTVTPTKPPKPEPKKIEVVKRPKRIITPAPPVQRPTRKTMAAELFTIERRKINIEDQRISRINSQRRAAVEIKVRQEGEKQESEPTKYKNTQEKWEEKQTVSSYPVDMKRVITVDRLIPAILINDIQSDLGGKVTAQIEENVLGAHGSFILIPAGSKAVGRYEGLKKVGEERLKISWLRIITPSGINIHTENAEMTDQMGRSGLGGNVNRRYGERYGISLLVSILSAATTYSIPVDNTNQQVTVEGFGREQNSLAKAILEEHIDIKPRIKIPAGSRILISATRDIWFQKAQENKIKALPLKES